MRLSLGKVKEKLANKAPADRLEDRLSAVCERLITSGKWKGSLHNVALNVRYGDLALPPQYSAIEGIKVDGSVRELVNLWYTYIAGKADTYGYSMETVQNLDDGHPTMYPLPLGGRGYSGASALVTGGGGAGATVTVETRDGSISGIDVDNPGSGFVSAPTIVFSGGSGANAVATISDGMVDSVSLIVGGNLVFDYPGSDTLVLTIYGTDENYQPVVLPIIGKSTVVNPFTYIDRVHKETGNVGVTLTHTAIDGSQTPLVVMSATEEEFYIHRYRIEALATKQEATVMALCKLRFREFTSDNDILPFANLSALSLGMDAINFEAEADTVRAGQYWALAIKVLNDELLDSHAVDEYPVARFIYPGNSQIRLRSFY